jgi:hypothetical protein
MLLATDASAKAPETAPAPPLGRTFLSPFGQPYRPSPDAPDAFAAWFAHVDANHDGRIDRAEFRADAEAFFKELDANADGRVDGFEINAYEHHIAPELVTAYEPPGGGQRREPRDGGRERGGRGYVALLNEPEPVSNADFDLDSRVSADEWRRATERRFDLLDTAKLGYLTRDELAARLPKPGKPKRR